MMNESQFDLWCRRNNITDKARLIIEQIRFSEPVRSVYSKRNNVSGKYPSKKMGLTIQFESSTVEFSAIYNMEHDPDVFEYYDQPNSMKLNYLNHNQKNVGSIYTPDFFVIRKNSAMWEEWKTEEELLLLSSKNPNRYLKDNLGIWRCPSAEDYAAKLGLEFRVHSSSEINVTLLRNLQFLEDYILDDDKSIEESKKREVQNIISENSVILLSNLIKQGINFNADDLYNLLVRGHIYIDINKYNLGEYQETPVFLREEHYLTLQKIEDSARNCQYKFESLNLKVGEELSWEGQRWKIANLGSEHITIINKENVFIELSKEMIISLFNDKKIQGISIVNEPKFFQKGKELLLEASPEQLSEATRKLELVKRSLKGERNLADEVSARTLADWVKSYREGEELYGNGYISLIPQTQKRGNRQNKLPTETLYLLEKFIETEYENIKQKSRKVVYGALLNECESKGIVAPSYKTFCKYVAKRPREESVKKREGKRAAYKYEKFYWSLEQRTPRHGDRPFEICHIDHTELDIEVVFSNSEQKSCRPYITLLVDAYSRKILAHYLTFDAPSYRSIMMVLRECVKKYSRLPQVLVVDGGKEFQSTYFENLLATYECTKKLRPAAKPRYGSVIERLFGTTNTLFVHNLQGHTKIMKNVRQVTKSVNPKNHALWNLAELNKELQRWIHEIYHKLEHPALGGTPKKTFELGIALGGNRPYRMIRYDEIFEIMTLPTTSRQKAKIQIGMGVKINYIYYWTDIFKEPDIEGTSVPVRYDPFDLGIAYAFVKGKWVKCISQYYSIFKGKTENELKVISNEVRKRHQSHAKNLHMSAKLIAQYIGQVEEIEKLKVQRAKDKEVKTSLRTVNTGQDLNKSQHKVSPINEDKSRIDYSKLKMLDFFEEC
ncbi:TnsA endonuclease N-terminal domain-containing protein [Priestia megaterium]|uniref:TnsA endonuclease N-terminal domain-containing protein n=1 Tax=Priestia megaterium TaxID=1404 RepID=UPI0022B8F70B|nr:TnsA endonuclease N-terminal domain-containing protein [Priestia megaterium]MCZ8494037.1 DDE-type integrase/transposase/recombinase [Priestia megaterium]